MNVRMLRLTDIVVAPQRRAARDVDGLARSIATVGLLNPITVTKALTLVAGHRRLLACKQLGLAKIPALVVSLGELDARLAELDENILRDNGTQLERAEWINEQKELYEARHPQTRRGTAGGLARHRSASDTVSFAAHAGARIGCDKRTVQREIQIATHLGDRAKELLRNTPLADNQAELLRLSRAPQETQIPAAKLLAGNQARTVAAAVRTVEDRRRQRELRTRALVASPASDAWEVIVGDCEDQLGTLADRLRGQVPMVFADPPYNEGRNYGDGSESDDLPVDRYLAWCARWMRLAAELLAPGGSIWTVISQEHVAEFWRLLRDLGLDCRAWVVWYETFGTNRSDNFNRCARHLLHFVRDESRFCFRRAEVMRPSARQRIHADRRAAPGGKVLDDVWVVPRLPGNSSERLPGAFQTQLPVEIVRRAIACRTEPGDLVVDPFSGSATTGVVANAMGRRFLGIEKNSERSAASILRLRREQAEGYAATHASFQRQQAFEERFLNALAVAATYTATPAANDTAHRPGIRKRRPGMRVG